MVKVLGKDIPVVIESSPDSDFGHFVNEPGKTAITISSDLSPEDHESTLFHEKLEAAFVFSGLDNLLTESQAEASIRLAETVYMEHIKDLPFIQITVSETSFIRIFESNTDSEEFIWHRDHNTRTVGVLFNDGNWEFQRDNELPFVMNDSFDIVEGEFHRIIKGTGPLILLIEEHQP